MERLRLPFSPVHTNHVYTVERSVMKLLQNFLFPIANIPLIDTARYVAVRLICHEDNNVIGQNLDQTLRYRNALSRVMIT
jgi:hypothetical protein